MRLGKIVATITLGFLLFVGISMAAGGQTFDFNPQEDLHLDGIVTPSSVGPLVDKILAESPTKPVMKMVINSPGGLVSSGQQLIQAMTMAQSRGTKFYCAVTGMAASMAFQVFTACDYRYMLGSSLLLWHPPRIFMGREPLTPQMARYLARDLSRMDVNLREFARQRLNAPEKWYRYHHLNETFWFGTDLNKALPGRFTVVKDVSGISTLAYRKSGLFGLRGILYIQPRLFEQDKK